MGPSREVQTCEVFLEAEERAREPDVVTATMTCSRVHQRKTLLGDKPHGQCCPVLSPALSPWNKITDSSIPRVFGHAPAGFFWSCIQVRRRTHLHLPLFSLKVEVLQGLVPSTDTPVFSQSPQVILSMLTVSVPSGC